MITYINRGSGGVFEVYVEIYLPMSSLYVLYVVVVGGKDSEVIRESTFLVLQNNPRSKFTNKIPYFNE